MREIDGSMPRPIASGVMAIHLDDADADAPTMLMAGDAVRVEGAGVVVDGTVVEASGHLLDPQDDRAPDDPPDGFSLHVVRPAQHLSAGKQITMELVAVLDRQMGQERKAQLFLMNSR